jgi:hypothetical protein
MLIRPTPEQLLDFGEPDFIIYNAGQFPANRFTKGMSSTTSVEINFKRMEMVILGTEYAGEMKKGVFSVMVSEVSIPGLIFAHLLPSITYNLSSSASFLSTLPPTSASIITMSHFSSVFRELARPHSRPTPVVSLLVTTSTSGQTLVYSTSRVDVTLNASTFRPKRSQIFSMPSNSAASSRTSSTTL